MWRSQLGTRRAFSLVELTVVTVIIALVAGMAYPRYTSSLSRYRVDLSAKRLAADLALAQTTARSKGSFQTITFSPDTDRYQLNEQATLSTAGGRYTVILTGSPFFTDLQSVRTSLGANVATLKFDGYGRADQGVIAKLACGDHTRTVTVDAQSGAINVTTP